MAEPLDKYQDRPGQGLQHLPGPLTPEETRQVEEDEQDAQAREQRGDFYGLYSRQRTQELDTLIPEALSRAERTGDHTEVRRLQDEAFRLQFRRLDSRIDTTGPNRKSRVPMRLGGPQHEDDPYMGFLQEEVSRLGVGAFANPGIASATPPSEDPVASSDAYMGFLQEESRALWRPTETGQRSEQLGQHNILPRVGSFLGEVITSPIHAFQRAWESESRGERADPGDVLNMAMAVGPGIATAEGGAVGVFGGRVGARGQGFRIIEEGRVVDPVTPQGPESIRSAAIRVGDDVFLGDNHVTAVQQAARRLEVDEGDIWSRIVFQDRHGGLESDGFLTTHGRYVSRQEAMSMARVSADSNSSRTGNLASEDILPISSQTKQEQANRLGRQGPATPQQVLSFLESSDARVLETRVRGGTTYIRIAPPNPGIPRPGVVIRNPEIYDSVIVRIPDPRDPHAARRHSPTAPANLFDTASQHGTKTRLNPAINQNAEGGSLSVWSNLADALRWRLHRAPDGGNWLVSPGREPRGARYAREEPIVVPPAMPDPRQLNLPLED